MRVRYYIDPATQVPHVYNHGVSDEEVEGILERPVEDRPGRDGSRVAIGKTSGGRYLRVIYVPDPTPGSVFVITAYELRGGNPYKPIDGGSAVEGDRDEQTTVPSGLG